MSKQALNTPRSVDVLDSSKDVTVTLEAPPSWWDLLVEWWNSLPWWQKTLIATTAIVGIGGTVTVALTKRK